MMEGEIMSDTYPYAFANKIDETEKYKFRIGNHQGTLVTIDMRDGAVTFGEHYTPDEAARVFWEAIGMSAHRPVIQS